MSQSQSQSGTETNGLVRRIIRDAKTEVKFQIFNMVAMPEPIDFPNRVTRLLFEQTDKIQIAYETYYRQKGIRVVTRQRTNFFCVIEDFIGQEIFELKYQHPTNGW